MPLFQKTNPCVKKIVRTIEQSGPMTLAAFMEEALTGEHGYYKRAADPLGKDGDFTTSPEISQMFGELIGLWAVDQYHKLNYPLEFNLCEIGPGRGTLMADALRGTAKVSKSLTQAKLHLCETNPLLREKQKQALGNYSPRWIEDLKDLPRLPTIFIANEFFDALPVEQVIYDGEQWHPRKIAYDKEKKKLFFQSSADIFDTTPIADMLPADDLMPGDIFEYSPESWRWLNQIIHHIRTYGGAALVIDYGHLQSGFGDTFQAVLKHEHVDALAHPGEADLTCHVDFAAFRKIIKKSNLHIHDYTTQGEFLKRCGIEARLKQLMASATPSQQESLQSGMHRLTLPSQMGSLFKVLSFSSIAGA